MITLDQAKSLTNGQTLHHVHLRNADGTPQRWRVNGKTKQWKTSPDRIKVPLKHGLRDYAYLTELDLTQFCLTPEEAVLTGQGLMNQADYLWYVILNKKILSGWTYREDAKESVSDLPDDSDKNRMEVLSYRTLERTGLNPDDNDNWAK